MDKPGNTLPNLTPIRSGEASSEKEILLLLDELDHYDRTRTRIQLEDMLYQAEQAQKIRHRLEELENNKQAHRISVVLAVTVVVVVITVIAVSATASYTLIGHAISIISLAIKGPISRGKFSSTIVQAVVGFSIGAGAGILFLIVRDKVDEARKRRQKHQNYLINKDLFQDVSNNVEDLLA